MSAAECAFGYTRVRARKAGLWTRDDALVHLARAPHLRTVPEALYAALAGDYTVLHRAYRSARALLAALWRRHEIENVKLAWRARALALPPRVWRGVWRPLGSRAAIDPEQVERSTSLASLVHSMRRTPYAAVAATALRAHEHDPFAAELLFERWAYASVVDEVTAMPAREHRAAKLVLELVRERDLDRVRRAMPAYGMTPELAPGLTVQLAREMPPAAIERIAAWRPADGPLGARLPSRIVPRATQAADWDALMTALRAERRRACIRAFMSDPFAIAPAVAYVFLREAEIEGRLAIASGFAKKAPSALERTLASSLMGA